MRLLLLGILCLTLTGCFTATRTIITELDDSGKVVRVIETSESVVSSVMASTSNKSIFIWNSRIGARIKATMMTPDTPTPTVDIGLDYENSGFVSLHANHSAKDATELIKAARAGSLSLYPTKITAVTSTEEEESQ